MALPKSSLSQVCKAIADFVGDRLQASKHSMRVTIGCPSDAAPSDGEHTINLFFCRIEPAGFFTGGTPGDTWWVRLQCLVTGFGSSEEKISAGENDLRLLGEVMRLFHENPVLPELTVGDETFRSMALMAVAEMPLFSESSWSVSPFFFLMLLILFPTSSESTAQTSVSCSLDRRSGLMILILHKIAS